VAGTGTSIRGEPTRHVFSPVKREQFLGWLRKGYTVTAAANACDMSRRGCYQCRDNDKELAAAWDDAIEAGKDFLEDEARRRAVEGTTRPVFYKGEVCGGIQEFSDLLMLSMLKARRPEYRESTKLDVNATLNINIVERLEAARARVRAGDDAKVIGHEPGPP
jgi:hypothetical protein